MGTLYEGLGEAELNAVETTLQWMASLTDQQRASVFEALTDNYCPSCGRAQPEDGDLCECVETARRAR